MSKVELVELGLTWTIIIQWLIVACHFLCPVNEQVIEWTMAYELQCAE